jgi:lipoprotein NlpI
MKRIAMVVVGVFLAAVLGNAGQQPAADDLLKQADVAHKMGETEKAIQLASKAIDLAPKHVPAYLFRATMFEALHKNKEALADYSQALKLDPKIATAYQHRGLIHFKLGNIKESIADFDKYIEMEPKAKASHWQRGISYYYAGLYKEGKEQFEGYQTFDSNDVENAVWRYLCMVPLVGKAKAQLDILKIGDDKRVPMKQIYDLFAGKLKPKDVLDAANAGMPSAAELNKRLFYAHLYLGLYHQSEGDDNQALEHLTIAVTKHPIGHYMWDVARVNREILLVKNK